jgi:hypothetical protein
MWVDKYGYDDTSAPWEDKVVAFDNLLASKAIYLLNFGALYVIYAVILSQYHRKELQLKNIIQYKDMCVCDHDGAWEHGIDTLDGIFQLCDRYKIYFNRQHLCKIFFNLHNVNSSFSNSKPDYSW